MKINLLELKHLTKFFYRNREVTYDKKRKILEKYRKKFKTDIFIETGTFLGDTSYYFKDRFDKVYSIELSKELATRAKDRFKECPNVEILQGNSPEVYKITSEGF